LLGSLVIALFWRRLGARATMAGMIASLVVMNCIYWPANIPALQPWWRATFGGEVFWPWFTVIGAAVTLGVAWATRTLWPEREAVKRTTLEN
jgi:Na+/proline symporter